MARYGKIQSMTRADFEGSLVVELAQLERVCGVERRRLRRTLLASGARLSRTGNRHVVCPSELRRVLPAVYEALLGFMAPG